MFFHPNKITTFRILIICLGCVLLVLPQLFFVGLLIIIGGSLTDYLDGYVARKYKLSSDFGKIYDPVADKISAVAVMAAMVYLGVIPIWLMALVIVRDYLIGLIRDYSQLTYHQIIAANWFGKRKVELMTLIAITLLLFWRYDVAFAQTKWILYGLVLLANYLSLLIYWRQFLQSRGGEPQEGVRN